MYDEDVTIKAGIVFEPDKTSIQDVKKQIEEIKAEYQKVYDEKRVKVKPKGRSEANKQLQKEVAELGQIIIELEAAETKLSNMEKAASATQNLTREIKNQAQLLQDSYKTLDLIEQKEKELETGLIKENELRKQITNTESELNSLEKEQAELNAKSTLSDAENNRRMDILIEKKNVRELLDSQRGQLANQESYNKELQEGIAYQRQQVTLLEKQATNEEAYKEYVEQTTSSQTDNSGELKNTVKELNEVLSKSKEILDINKENNSVVKDTTENTKAQTGTKQTKSKADDNFGGNFMRRQAYYNLRQIRLIQSELDRIDKNTKKVANGFRKSIQIMFKAVTSLALGFTNLHKSTERATSANKKFSKGLSSNLWTVLRYTIGIRSLFALTNRLRTALSQGMQNLALYSSHVNQQMSSLVTSLLMMKNAVAAAAQPFLNILAPALEVVSARVNELSFNIAQLIASLTGQSFVYKAKRAQVDYAASLNKTADAAKKVVKELGEYDKLEVISKDKDTGSGMPDPSEMFETISPISDFIKDIADRIKNLAAQFFAPIKKAWESEGKYVMDSWKYALNEVWGLIKDIGRDFLIMWNEEATVRMWENIFHIIGDIGQVIGNIAKNLRDAWNENDTGLKIWRDLRDIVATVVQHIRNVADYAVDWSSKLNFGPLLTTFEELLTSLNKVADFLGGVFEDVMESVVFKYIQWLIDYGIPNLNSALKDIIEKFDWDGFRETLKPLWEAIENLMEASFAGLTESIHNLGIEVGNFLESDDFKDFIKNITNFINRIKPEIVEKVFTAIGDALLMIAGLFIRFINSSLVQGFLNALLDFVENKSSKELAVILVAIAGAIGVFKFVEFVGKGVFNAMEFFNVLSSLGKAGGIATIAGHVATLATNIGLLVGALADLEAAVEFLKFWKKSDVATALPTIGTDADGTAEEIGGLQGKFIDLRNTIVEAFGGETIDKTFISPSSVEKMEDMKNQMDYIDDSMQDLGIATDETNDYINEFYQIWYDNGEKFNGLSEEQTKRLNECYNAVRDYYKEAANTKEAKKAVEDFNKSFTQYGESSMNTFIDKAASTAKSASAKLQLTSAGGWVARGVEAGIQTVADDEKPETLWGWIGKYFTNFYKIHSPSKVMEEYGTNLVDGLKLGITEAWSKISSELKTKMDNIKTTVVSSINTIKQNWTNSFNQLKNPTIQIFNGILNGIKGPINGIISGVERMVNGIISAFNSLGDMLGHMNFQVPDWVPMIGGNSFNIGLPHLSQIRIPRLAQGAVIPPNKEFMAMLGDQKQGTNIETPLETMIEAFKAALEEEGGSNHEPIVLQLDGKTVAKVVWDETDKKYKQTGKYVPSYA